MQLEYYVEADEFGDDWLTFKSTLHSETYSLASGSIVSQWYQVEQFEYDDMEDADEHEGHDHRRALPTDDHADHEDHDEEYFESVQVTVMIDEEHSDVEEENRHLLQYSGEGKFN